jgi:hypothetical protein
LNSGKLASHDTGTDALPLTWWTFLEKWCVKVQPFLFGKSTCRSVAFASNTGATM